MQLQTFFKALRRSWWIIGLVALAALSLALVIAYMATPQYRARAQFIVSPGPSLLASQDRDLIDGIEALDKRTIVATYAEVMGSGRIQREAAEDLGILPPELAAYQFSAVVLPSASVLEVAVSGPNPEKAAQLANQTGERAISFIEERYLVFKVEMLTPAQPARQPFLPNPGRDASLALVLGLIFGTTLAVVREQALPLAGRPVEQLYTLPDHSGTTINNKETVITRLEHDRKTDSN